MSTADNFITEILDFFRSGQFLRDVVDIVIQVVVDALGLNIFIYQDNNGYLEVLKVYGGHCPKIYVLNSRMTTGTALVTTMNQLLGKWEMMRKIQV